MVITLIDQLNSARSEHVRNSKFTHAQVLRTIACRSAEAFHDENTELVHQVKNLFHNSQADATDLVAAYMAKHGVYCSVPRVGACTAEGTTGLRRALSPM